MIGRLRRRLRRVFAGLRRGELPPWNEWDDDAGVGVREPRRPRPTPNTGAVALERPPDELPPPDAVGR